jgi:uncharacterized LabA/DUF88 family protein
VSQPDSELFQRLGPDGLARVLHDVLDPARLVRLATACGISYPGMRTRSQKPERLLADLVDRAGREDTARKAVSRALKKEAAAAVRRWGRLSSEEKLDGLNDLDPRAEGALGLHLYLLARGDLDDGLRDGFEQLLGRHDLRPLAAASADDRATAKTAREATRLRKKVADLEKKLRHQETQLGKARETQKSTKRDLLRSKGELAESRMLADRLRDELRKAEAEANEAASRASRAPSEENLEKLTGGTRKLANEQRKLTHAVEKLAARPVPTAGLRAADLAPLQEGFEALQKELAGLRRDRRRETRELGRALEELRGEVGTLKKAVGRRFPAPVRRSGPERVGVFIDVQNMYYGARQLKGKLDFDALLSAAVRDRRMVQAQAYVVESKEIDQSGFISMLQQRAIEVRSKRLKVRADGSMKGDWDMEMALDILDAATGLDVVVLVSGDGDFTSLVGRIKRMGPRVEVIGWPRTTAKSLLEAADSFQPLDRKFMIRTPEDRTDSRSRRGTAAPS